MFKVRLWGKISLAFLSTLLALVGTEVSLRVTSKYSLHLLDIEMWRYAREIKYESELPGLIQNHRPNTESELMGVRIRTDSAGFRRPDANTESLRGPNNQVVVVLGDSFTLGWGVPEGQTYPDLLERILNERARHSNSRQFTVKNAGIGNSNTSMELARYEHEIRALHPQWIILGFFINDSEPDPKPAKSLLIRNSALITLLATQLKLQFEAPSLNYISYYRALYEDDKPEWVRFKSALAKLGQDLRVDNVRATILLLPEMHEPKNFGPFSDVYQRVADLARLHGFEVIDASREFPSGPGNRFWVTAEDAHPNAAAHQIFANAVAGSRYASNDGFNK